MCNHLYTCTSIIYIYICMYVYTHSCQNIRNLLCKGAFDHFKGTPHSFRAAKPEILLQYERRDSFTCAPWRIHICLVNESRLIHICTMTHLYVHICTTSHSHLFRRDSFTCVPWRIHICTMTHLYVEKEKRVPFMSATIEQWLIS